jgi:oxalate decarboxylase/phosphoglucose isomerase-like protein (cupin superfamily)
MDYASPKAQFTFDLKNDVFYKKDARNYINRLSIKDLNTLGNYSLLDIYLSTGNVIEPHYHQNASELVYCISGAAVVSIVNPFTAKLLNFQIQPGQVANVPQGWWHYEVATVDNTHLLAIFDAPVPEAIFGSDILRLTPASVWAHTYCLNEAKVKETFAPIQTTTIIGPPSSCKQAQPMRTTQGGEAGAHGQPNAGYGNPAYGQQGYRTL